MSATNAPDLPIDRSTRSFLQRVINPQKTQSALVTTASSLAAVVLAFILCAVLLELTGKDAIGAYQKMFTTGFTRDKLYETLQRASPLMLSGVAVAIGFKMNLFNIGVEGQYLIGVFIAAVIGAKLDLPAPIHVAVILLVGMATGAAWAAIAGLLKVFRGVNEVISTIMLNSIALAVIDWMFLEWFRETSSDVLNVETKKLPRSGWMPDLVKGKLSGFIIITLVVVVLYWIIVFKSRFGFRLRASGANPVAARTSGISAGRMVVLAMILSGAVAGLVGMQSMLGTVHAYGQAIPSGFGFAGISVALLGRNHPAGIVPAALLFGFLNATTSALQLKQVPGPIVEVMQAVILLTVVIVNEVVGHWMARRTQSKTAAALEHVAPAGAPAGAPA